MIKTETEGIVLKIKRMIRFFLCISLSFAVCALFCACGNQPDAKQSETAAQETTVAQTDASLSEHRKIIIDTDTGADDASALILASKQKNVEILGVTVLVGNVDLEQSTQNALAALETAGCDAPVYKGSADTIDGTVKTAFSVFGSDGMGDADLIHPKKQAEDGDAVDFIIDTVNTHASCITEQGETYSQVIFYKEGFTYDTVKNDFDYHAALVTDVDKPAYFKNFAEAIR